VPDRERVTVDAERVTVVAGGAVRLYSVNGDGLLEYATIIADLSPEDAASLTIALDGFLAGKDRLRARSAPIAATAVRTAPRALSGAESSAGPRTDPNAVYRQVATYVATHPGETKREIAAALRLPDVKTQHHLNRARKQGMIESRHRRWYATDQAPDEAPLTVRPAPRRKYQRSGAPRVERTTEQIDAEYRKIVDHVTANPGVLRSELPDAIGIDRVTLSNRVMALVGRGTIEQRPAPTQKYPRAVSLWIK